MSNRLATLGELDTIYSLEDAYLLLEIVEVDSYNRRVLNRKTDG